MSISDKDRKYLVDPVTLRSSAEAMRRQGFDIVAQQLDAAAAEIEGGSEAFGVVVDQKRQLEAELSATRHNHRHTLDMLGRWRQLLDVLAQELPNDIRLTRARAGEHPLRPAVWEKWP